MPPEPNRAAMRALASELARRGVTEACISPGSRSTPMVLALDEVPGLRTWVVTDERAAGYFALGMARETGRPAALLCTSGTAAAGYLPAVVEASLQQVPLVVLTADRPPELRDCAAPQTIDQVRLFGSHARWSADATPPAPGLDLEAYYRALGLRAVAAALEDPPGPVHLNLPMREPLVDVEAERSAPPASARPVELPLAAARAAPAPAALDALAARLAGRERVLVVCGTSELREGAAHAVAALGARQGWAVLADPLSGLRFGLHDRTAVIDAYDVLLRDPEFCARARPDAVLQIGALPVSKSLQSFLQGAPHDVHVMVSDPRTWPDPLHRATDAVRGDPGALAEGLVERLAPAAQRPWLALWRRASSAARAALDARLEKEPGLFEGAVFTRLRPALPPDAALCVGNSMPVRDLDTFLGGGEAKLRVLGNRGASGIDGVLSTALGVAAVRAGPTVLVLGDLSFLHDGGGLQIAHRHRLSLLVVVINNDGGGVFSFLPQAGLDGRFERYFGTPHGIPLAPAVQACGGAHREVASWEELDRAVREGLAQGGLQVLEIRGDRARNRALHASVLEDVAGAAVRAAEGT